MRKLAFVGVLLAGCGLVTAGARPEPPPHERSVDSATEWREIKANRTAPRLGALAIAAHPMPPGSIAMIPTVRARLMPYADPVREELEILLRWRYGGGLYYPSKVTDAPAYIDEALTRYRRALAVAGLDDLFHDLELPLDQTVKLALTGGDYLVLSEYRTQGRGPTYKVWVWLRRVSVRPDAVTDLALGDDDRMCFESWAPSGTSCR